ncbi:MAG: proton glutamate symport protein, partial [Myxococcota bacterium]
MQIYTKILIGMAVGAVVGLTVGPTSSLLPHDLYKVKDAGSIHLRLDKDNPDSAVPLPSGVEIELLTQEVVEGPVADESGKEHTVPVWTKVLLTVSKPLSLTMAKQKRYPKDVKAAEAVKEWKADEDVEVWLKMAHTPLISSVMTSPVPISKIGDRILSVLSPIGAIFMRLITMVIVPLVFSSLLVGVASLGDIRKLGRLGGKTLGLYLMTTAVAVTIGLMVAHLVNPGSFIADDDRAALTRQFDSAAEGKMEEASKAPSAIDNIINIIPENPVAALATKNMLQIIFFALIFGIALTMMGVNESQIVVTFFDKVQQAMVMVIHMVMIIAPFGVMALIAEVVGTSGLSVLGALMVYGLTVLLGLALHAGIVYVGLVRVFTPLTVGRFLRAIRPAQLVAFSTSSSSATLPVSMEVAEENLRISNPIASFVLPLGSTVNMDGTALYQGVAAVFIAQVFDVTLTMGDQLGIVLTATMASIGAAGVPGAGMVTLAMVLTASGIPAVGVALILGMDRILDMFRTAVNVTGDLAVTSVMAATEGETLEPLTDEQDSADPDHGFEGR